MKISVKPVRGSHGCSAGFIGAMASTVTRNCPAQPVRFVQRLSPASSGVHIHRAGVPRSFGTVVSLSESRYFECCWCPVIVFAYSM